MSGDVPDGVGNSTGVRVLEVTPAGDLGEPGDTVTFRATYNSLLAATASWHFGGGATALEPGNPVCRAVLGATGTYSGSVSIQSATGSSAPFPFSYTVLPKSAGRCGPLGIVTSTLPDAIVGVDYYVPILITRAIPPFTVMLDNGTLPPGFKVESSAVSGNTTLAGDYQFVLRITDSCPDGPRTIYSKRFTFHVAPAPP